MIISYSPVSSILLSTFTLKNDIFFFFNHVRAFIGMGLSTYLKRKPAAFFF